MTTAEYRDEISHLSDLIASAKGCLESERSAEMARVEAQWGRLAVVISEPKRCPKAVAEKRDRVMKMAADAMNDFHPCNLNLA